MPSFRQPEWQQPADRHTQLVDPVLTVRQLARFEFNFRSLVRVDHALVFATPKGSYEAYLPPHRPTRSEITAKRYSAVYEVDMGVHPHTAVLNLPSDNDAFEFTAEVDLSWQVLDPARFVASGHRDVPALVLGELQQAARPVTRRFPVAQSASAEQELLQAVTVLGPLGATAGLQVTWTLRLRRDQADIEHQQRLRAIGHSATEQAYAAQRGMEVDVEVDRRLRQQDALQIERAVAYGTQQHELLLQQQRQQHELALQQGRQQIELQQIEAQKIAFYQHHLQQGGVHSWALHLAQHPEDSHLVMSSMREDQLRMIQAQMDLVKQLLSGDTAENYELEGPKQLALRTVSDILNQRLPGVPQHPPLLPEGAGGAPGYAPQVPGGIGYGAPTGAVPGYGTPAGAVPGYGTPAGAVPGYGTPAGAVPGYGTSPAAAVPAAQPSPTPPPAAQPSDAPPPAGPSDAPPTGQSAAGQSVAVGKGPADAIPPATAPAPQPLGPAAAPAPPTSASPPLPPVPPAAPATPAASPAPNTPSAPPAPPATPYSPPGMPGPYAAVPGFPPPPAYAPPPPAWQPPPGYGTTPTVPDPRTAAETDGVQAPDDDGDGSAP
ncbi:hypothetical protein [Streptomyces camelliae]|uniref:PE-PGRS family protein n=1 Tax=Streptomyces camelliae TaxID=3004093 RepID=A0ABY7P420_9ACTN|nr:hypothetical protein [Streptomyces sp. HUAS 2-6]WBO64442.1 hypothetical protein O1G22_17170 [Streptomyces sp. HUAS 2-6]